MAQKTYFFMDKPAGKRWRYLVDEHGAAMEDGGWYFTNRLEAAEHCRRIEMSTGKRYDLRDLRILPASVLAGRAALAQQRG